MKDTIKIAEMMGWRWSENSNKEAGGGRWYRPDGSYTDLCIKYAEIPDPYTDANDDYAVLEWMRESEERLDDGGALFAKFIFALRYIQRTRGTLTNVNSEGYEIGDYAKAALKVIDHE